MFSVMVNLVTKLMTKLLTRVSFQKYHGTKMGSPMFSNANIGMKNLEQRLIIFSIQNIYEKSTFLRINPAQYVIATNGISAAVVYIFRVPMYSFY